MRSTLPEDYSGFLVKKGVGAIGMRVWVRVQASDVSRLLPPLV